jgi:hypothetical protein
MATFKWNDELESTKKEKIQELNKMCNMTILGRFTSVVNGAPYQFSNDMEAQANFEKCDRAFDNGRIQEIAWTVYNSEGQVERVLLDPVTFEGVYLDHLAHIQNNISKFRDFLMPQVEEATTVEEVKQIKW